MSTILIAVDHGPLRSLLSSVLMSAGHNVIEACDAGQALSLGKQYKSSIDLLCAHVAMDRMGDTELAQDLRHEYPGMKVLLLVKENPRYVQVDAQEATEHEAAYSVLRKPFTIEQLLHTIEQTLKPAPIPG